MVNVNGFKCVVVCDFIKDGKVGFVNFGGIFVYCRVEGSLGVYCDLDGFVDMESVNV